MDTFYNIGNFIGGTIYIRNAGNGLIELKIGDKVPVYEQHICGVKTQTTSDNQPKCAHSQVPIKNCEALQAKYLIKIYMQHKDWCIVL